MSPSTQGQQRAGRQCPNCGKYVPAERTQCPECREMLSVIAVAAPHTAPRRVEFRRGLLYMLLAAVIHYFLGGYSGMNLPFEIHPMVREYLAPLIFLSGIGLIVYGSVSRSRT